jgi:hypothetical protein
MTIENMEKENFQSSAIDFTKYVKDGFNIHENGKIELSIGIHNGKLEKLMLLTIPSKRLPMGSSE